MWAITTNGEIQMDRGRPDNALEYAPSGELYQGSAIRQMRKAKGIGLRQLAALIPYDAGALSRVENNRAIVPSETLESIAKILEIDAHELAEIPLHPRLYKQSAGAGEQSATVEQKLAEVKAEVQEVKAELTEVKDALKDLHHALREFVPFSVVRPSPKQEEAPSSLEHSHQDELGVQGIIAAMSARARQESTQPVGIKLNGAYELLSRVIGGLNSLPELDKPHSGRIMFTCLIEEDAFRHAAELEKYWLPALTSAMDNGWDVVQFIWLNDDVSRTSNLVRNILSLLGRRGSYKVYFTKTWALRGAFDFLAVDTSNNEMRRAFVLDASGPGQRHANAGYFYSYSRSEYQPIDNILNLLKRWEQGEEGFQQLLRVEQDLQKNLAAAREWDKLVTEVEAQEGDLFLVMKGFAGNTVPDDQYREQVKPILKRGGEEAKLIRHALNFRNKRITAFQDQVQRHKFYQIIPMATVMEWYKETGTPSPDAWPYLFKGNPAPPAQQAKHLRAILDLLDTYSKSGNYQIGLLKGDPGQYDKVFWQVKGTHTVLLENFVSGVELDVSITERTVAEAFRAEFMRLWKSERVITDQASVKKWLRECAEERESVIA